MKTPALLTLAAALAVLPAAGLRAQAPAPAATPSVSAPASTHAADQADDEAGVRARAMKVLTPEERHRLQVANHAAQQDPAVQAAKAHRDTPQEKRAFREAVKAAMLRADPGVAPLFEKLKEARRESQGKAPKN